MITYLWLNEKIYLLNIKLYYKTIFANNGFMYIKEIIIFTL